ncbi:MAG: hypothetical protein P8R54_26755 [Myxococcota bacterium]|nr:hypothetical protein [Myxococcota bacterium]
MAEEMTAYSSAHASNRPFALPDDHARWRPLQGCPTSQGGTDGFRGHTPSTVVANTTYGCGIFNDLPVARRRLWLEDRPLKRPGRPLPVL